MSLLVARSISSGSTSPRRGAASEVLKTLGRCRTWLSSLVLLLGLLFASVVLAADDSAKSSRVAKPVIEAARGAQCVEPAADMRRNHMEYLKHQRDDTMRGGIRGAKYSLKTCIECHASQTTNSVTAAPTNFCISCHSYAAVKVDCFECHATQPAKSGAAFLPLVHPGGAHAALNRQLRQLGESSTKKP